MKIRMVSAMMGCAFFLGATALAQRTVKRPLRAIPPTFQPNEFSGVFFSDAVSQLQGEMPNAGAKVVEGGSKEGNAEASNESAPVEGKGLWKAIIASSSIEDLVKESKSRLDAVVTTPAKFASGGAIEARREFTLLASIMGVVAEYPEEIKWQSSASYTQRVFARVASNCKVGTAPVYNEAKERLADLQTLLKGSKVAGNADEVGWSGTADHGPTMQLLEWALRENLAPTTNNEKKFKDSQDEVVKYSELIGMFGLILQQPGMNLADDEQYVKYAVAMTQAAQDVSKAAKMNDAELARAAVGRIDQTCNKCHESYR